MRKLWRKLFRTEARRPPAQLDVQSMQVTVDGTVIFMARNKIYSYDPLTQCWTTLFKESPFTTIPTKETAPTKQE